MSCFAHCSDSGLPAAAWCGIGHVPSGNEIRVRVAQSLVPGFHDAQAPLTEVQHSSLAGVGTEMSVPYSGTSSHTDLLPPLNQ